MFDNLICNKYFVIFLIAVIIILLILYIRKQSCHRHEGMSMLQGTDVDEPAWGGNNVTKHNYNKNTSKLGHNLSHKSTNSGNYKSADSVHQRYLEFDNPSPSPIFDKPRSKFESKLINYDYDNVMPMDNRPDLGNCVPCQECKPCKPCKPCPRCAADSEIEMPTRKIRIPRIPVASRR